MKTGKRTLALLLALILALGALGACSKAPDQTRSPDQTDSPDVQPEKTPDAAPSGGAAAQPSVPDGQRTADVRTAASYDELFSSLEAVSAGMHYYEMADGAVAEAETPTASAAAGDEYKAEENDSDSASGGAAADYTDTNTQVEGVDEGDIVKTDGEYLYILRDGGKLTIARADGENTAVVSETDVCWDTSDGGLSSSSYGSELYLTDGRVTVLYESYRWGYDDAAGRYTDESTMGVRIYDVTDPAAPVLAADLAQDGYLAGSRVVDGTLYLVTDYYVYDADKDDPYGFVPCVYESGTARLLECDCIFIPEIRSYTGYAVVQAIDISAGTSVGEMSVLGGCGTLYMSRENLYLIAEDWEDIEGAPYEEDGYTVTEHTSYAQTQILRVSAAGGSLALAASGVIPGYPLSQYSFDEQNGYFRAVVSTNESVYRLYEDKKHQWTNYESVSDGQNCALYVLDLDLNEVSSLTELAPDERVYSVRFDGDMVYFVTFRETDPLFAVDLSDPAAPVVKSALKLPGYSSYLHVWSDGLLFGLGQQVGEESNRTEGIKLAMYDCSDPANLREIVTVHTDFAYSPAEYEARALCIEPSLSIVGFPAEMRSDMDWLDYYVICTYEDGRFSELGRYELSDWIYNTRGVRIGSAMYICGGNEIIVASLETGAELQHLILAVG